MKKEKIEKKMDFIDEKIRLKCSNPECKNFNKPAETTLKAVAAEINSPIEKVHLPDFLLLPTIHCARCGRKIYIEILREI